MLHSVLIFMGLSLDGFVVIMRKGAQLVNCSLKKKLEYAFIYAIVNVLMLLGGYGICHLVGSLIPDGKLEITIACLIMLCFGVILMTKAFKNKEFVEKVDKEFDEKKLIRLSLYTSIDTLFVGGGFAFLAVGSVSFTGICFLISLISSFIALEIGYTYGVRYQRLVGMLGGALMIIFSMFIFSMLVLKFML